MTSAGSAEDLLRVTRLSKHFLLPDGKPFKALDEVSFALRPRRTLGVVGESGCGKSTLARTLMRMHPASGGSVQFAGQTWIDSANGKSVSQDRTLMQMVFQDPFSSLDPKHSIGRIVREPMDINRRPTSRAERFERVRELLVTVGLDAADADKYPHEFSGGQRQRIAIARALALSPKLLVADEPVSALDVSIQSQILNLLMDLRSRHDMAMIFISHDLSVIRHLSDDIAVMYFGRIVEMAPAQTLLENPQHPYTQLLLSAVPRRSRAMSSKPDIVEIRDTELPDPANPPRGCAFAKRCPHAMPRCGDKVPELQTVAGTQVACYLHQTM